MDAPDVEQGNEREARPSVRPATRDGGLAGTEVRHRDPAVIVSTHMPQTEPGERFRMEPRTIHLFTVDLGRAEFAGGFDDLLSAEIQRQAAGCGGSSAAGGRSLQGPACAASSGDARGAIRDRWHSVATWEASHDCSINAIGSGFTSMLRIPATSCLSPFR